MHDFVELPLAFCPLPAILALDGPLAECPEERGEVGGVVGPTRLEVAEAAGVVADSSFWHFARRQRRAKWRRIGKGKEEDQWENIGAKEKQMERGGQLFQKEGELENEVCPEQPMYEIGTKWK
jgi:hypothetical protein